MSSLASDLSNQQMQIVESRNPQVHQQQQQQQQHPQQQPSHIQQPPQIQSATSIVSTIPPTASTSHQHQQQQQQQQHQQQTTTTNINVNPNQNLDDFLMINANVDTNSVTESNLSVLSVVPTSDTRNQNNSTVVTTTQNSPNSKQQLVVSQTSATSSVLLANKLSGVGVQGETENLSVIKKRILEHKYQRLRSIKEKYSEHVAELFFLQSSGNMMDYPVWRKKPPAPQFINFMKPFKLEQIPTDIDIETKLVSTTITPQGCLPQGAEIKISGVGITPVAVSTTLPAAVAQLNQQGGTPIVPDPTGAGINSQDRRKQLTGTSLTPSSFNNNNNGGAGSSQEPFSVKARQEVYVLQRIQELQREGMWAEKRLPKLQEPQRPKAHWDYLLEEMVWLAADFAQERKWKKAAAKKCARMVQKHFQEKALAAQKAEKSQEVQLKRIAAFCAKEIKIFWSNVEKLVEFKQQTKIDEKRKKALDQQLSFIVDQTERYSQQLTETMNKTLAVATTSKANSLTSSRISSPLGHTGSDDEFRPGDSSEDDDEETIAQAEAEATGTNEEVAALQKESEMELDDFLKELPKDYLQNRDKIVLSESEDDDHMDTEDRDFKADEDSEDDEDTIMEQESAEKGTDHKKEIAELEAENEMTIDELMAKYKNLPKPDKMEVDSDDDSTPADSDGDESDDDQVATGDESSEYDNDDEISLKNLLDLENSAHSNKDDAGTSSADVQQQKSDKDDLINDAAAIAESLQPKGNTLSSTSVVTPIPFLLKHTLREYQHIGLDWLVTMHDRKLNGILADEMGLGKTIQTIALLAHLACEKENWGPHLIIVPSSVMLNWEMEFKKWCPGFKTLTYYGSQKERKLKRIGWTKHNAFHVCITSYKLVIQDHQSFRRKKWKYLILDEAQNIKNFKSQRWQLLLNFQTEQRLLLTGTPLQNNLMELWSLMHFLMPNVFQSHREFKEWFSIPVTGMIEGNSEYNESIIKRLHKVLRPFLLRRLKSEVEKQMPKKYEHVVMCRLSKRQRYLYDDFMSRAKTKETLASGNLLSVINVLMQLRKVCNHPNMFETRPTISPFRMEGICYQSSSLFCNVLDYDPLKHINLSALNLVLIELELILSAYVAHRTKKITTNRKLIEEIDVAPDPPPKCPTGKLRLHVRIRNPQIKEVLGNTGDASGDSGLVKVGTSPAMKTEGSKIVPVSKLLLADKKSTTSLVDSSPSYNSLSTAVTTTPLTPAASTSRRRSEMVTPQKGRHVFLTPSSTTGGTVVTQTSSGSKRLSMVRGTKVTTAGGQLLKQPLADALVKQLKTQTSTGMSTVSLTTNTRFEEEAARRAQSEFFVAEKEEQRKQQRTYSLTLLAKINQRRCDSAPIFGSDLRSSVSEVVMSELRLTAPVSGSSSFTCRGYVSCQKVLHNHHYYRDWCVGRSIKAFDQRIQELDAVFRNFVFFVPAVCAPLPSLHVSHPSPSKVNVDMEQEVILKTALTPAMHLLHPIVSAMSTQFPDPRLIQYDCGKLQTLDRLLRKLKTGGHRVLIFTQMTRMLDVLESFLNCHGHIYLRLDGTTKIEQRQMLMDRFNADKRVFVFILSTRSGGVGVNLTGADTVIFYDSDWNPTMDAQAQDRCHRIGQTRDVNIYRLVSEKTIEENILKKANQKRLLGDLAIEGGNFTTAYFKSSSTIQDLFTVDNAEDDAAARLSEVVESDRERKERLQSEVVAVPTPVPSAIEETSKVGSLFEQALANAEDVQDVMAAKTAQAEAAADLAEFDENIPIDEEGGVNKEPELSKAEKEVQNIIKQLSPIERYAMKFVEETEGTWTAVQLNQIDQEIEQQKRDWEANRLAQLKKEEEEARRAETEDVMLTYSRQDATNQVNSNRNNKTKSNIRKQGFFKHNNKKSKGKKVVGGGAGSSRSSSSCSMGGSRTTAGGSTKVVLGKRKPDEKGKTSPNKKPLVTKKSTPVKDSPKKVKAKTVPSKPVMATSTPAKKRPAAQETKPKPKEKTPKKSPKKKKEETNGTLEPEPDVAKSKPTKPSANKKTGVPSAATSNAADESYSECSLDVMIDSNDAAPGTNASRASEVDNHEEDTSNDASQTRTLNGDESSIMTEQTDDHNADSDDEVLVKKSVLLEPTHFDLSSPRTTRSRGSVKINLWTLDDESPIMAPGMKRVTKTTSGKKNKRSKTESASEDLDEASDTIVGGDMDCSNQTVDTEIEEKSQASFDENINLNSTALVSTERPKKTIHQNDRFDVLMSSTLPKNRSAKGKKGNAHQQNSPQSPAPTNTLDSWIYRLPPKSTSTSRSSTPTLVVPDTPGATTIPSMAPVLVKLPDARYSRRQSTVPAKVTKKSENGTL